MEDAALIAALDRAERSLDEGGTLAGTGFWPAVEAVKRSPALAERYGQRIAAIDQRAFDPWPAITVPLVPGTVAASAVVVAGMAGVALAGALEEPGNWIVFGASTVALLGSTHGLGHLLVGKAVGIRFTKWFVAGPAQPQPGIKVEYQSYLRASARRRAWMHAAGALVTKVVPFALIPAAAAANLPGWVGWILLSAGVVAIVTDVTWSTKSSDWAKFNREMRHARHERLTGGSTRVPGRT